MFKKNVLVILIALSCNNMYGILDGNIINITTDQQNLDNHNGIGSLTLANTRALAIACVLVGLISTAGSLSSEDKENMFKMMTNVAGITTLGCIVTEGMKSINHPTNKSNQKNAELKADIKKLAD
jgi:hypothetical protein